MYNVHCTLLPFFLDFQGLRQSGQEGSFLRPGGWTKKVYIYLQSSLIILQLVALKRADCFNQFTVNQFTWKPFQSFLATKQLECLVEHHLGQWWHLPTICSILRRFWWRVANALGWFGFSCCLLRRYRRARELQRTSIQGRRPSRLGHRRRLVRRSYLFGGVGGFDRLGIGGRPCLIGTLAWPWSFQIFLCLTWLCFVMFFELVLNWWGCQGWRFSFIVKISVAAWLKSFENRNLK